MGSLPIIILLLVALALTLSLAAPTAEGGPTALRDE